MTLVAAAAAIPERHSGHHGEMGIDLPAINHPAFHHKASPLRSTEISSSAPFWHRNHVSEIAWFQHTDALLPTLAAASASPYRLESTAAVLARHFTIN